MKRQILLLLSITFICLNSISQTLSGTYLNIWSTDSHLGQFGLNDNSAGQTRPRVDIWGSASKINFRTTYNVGGAALSFGTNSVNDALLINEDGAISLSNCLTLWSTNSHLAQFAYNDNSAGQTRPRVDIWGSASKINFRTTYNVGGAALSFGTNSVNDALLIAENGNISIGTKDSKGFKLNVCGTIRANEVKVDLNGCDYVFENNYKMLSLNELESYIKENKHLPDIASAKEMQGSGVNLSDLNSKLLEKIEQLTLYIIEQQKQINKMKGKIEKIESR